VIDGREVTRSLACSDTSAFQEIIPSIVRELIHSVDDYVDSVERGIDFWSIPTILLDVAFPILTMFQIDRSDQRENAGMTLANCLTNEARISVNEYRSLCRQYAKIMATSP
jgi:hypothetical protein